MGKVVPETISGEEWIQIRRPEHFFFAFVAFVFLVLCLAGIDLYIALAVCSVIVCFAGIVVWANSYSDTKELSRLRIQIDATEAELQTALDKERQILAVVAAASGQANVIAHYNLRNPAIQELALSLKQLVTQLKDQAGAASLSEADNRRIRIADGLVANAECRYSDALKSVTEEDVEAQSASAQLEIDKAVKANQIRADASYGLRKWEQALAYYQQILHLRPGNSSATSNIGNCFALLGRWSDAFEIYDGAVTILTRLVEHKGWVELTNDLAASLNNRGNSLVGLAKYAEAMQDLDNKAIDIWTKLAEQKGRTEPAVELAKCLSNRGIAFGRLGKHSEAIADLNKTVTILTGLAECDGWQALVEYLATCLSNRGRTLGHLGKHAEAGLRTSTRP